MNRRGLLKLLGLGGVAVTLPVPPAAAKSELSGSLGGAPIFKGSLGTYDGVIIREVASLDREMVRMDFYPDSIDHLRRWYMRRGVSEWYEGEHEGSQNER